MTARFCFDFRDEAAAHAAVTQLEQEGLTVEVRRGADNASWFALGAAKLEDEGQLDSLEERFDGAGIGPGG